MLTGGSALGLAAADGVAQRLLRDGIGYPMGGPGEVVPIVPGAVIFDLGRGGSLRPPPGRRLRRGRLRRCRRPTSRRATAAPAPAQRPADSRVGSARRAPPSATVRRSAHWSWRTPPDHAWTRRPGLWAARHCLDGDLPALRRPAEAELLAAKVEAATQDTLSRPPLATTLAVIATDATLTKAQCAKVSGLGHDGLARAINPVHTMFDGDTVFTLATCAGEAPDPFAFHALLETAGTCVTRAVARAMLSAESTPGCAPSGTPSPRRSHDLSRGLRCCARVNAMGGLVLGPLLRHVDETSACVWVETEVRRRHRHGGRARGGGAHVRGPRSPLRPGLHRGPGAGHQDAVRRERRR